MLALRLSDRRIRLVRDAPVPEPPPGEALVRVLKAGICNTDLELLRGYRSFDGILGHEFVGVVERLGEGVERRDAERVVGRRVVGEINAACGTCRSCAAGRPTHCERRTVLGIKGRDGAFAEFLRLPVANLHVVPGSVSSEAAVFVEPLAAALRIRDQVPVSETDRVLVVGVGKLGMLVAQALALSGCELLAIGRRHARKPELHAGKPEQRAGKLELLAGRGIRAGTGEDVEPGAFDIAVECTGNPEGYALARRALRPGGTLVLKSTYAGRLTLDASALVVDEITLVGSRCGPFAPALGLLAKGRVDTRPLVDARYPLEEGVVALDHAGHAGTLKVILEVDGVPGV